MLKIVTNCEKRDISSVKLLSAIFTLCCVFVLKAQTKRALNYEGGYNGQVTKKI